MMKENYTIVLTCVFCDATLQGDEEKNYQSGDLIKCAECGEDNDYSSAYEIAKEKGLELVEKEVLDMFKKAFK